MKIWLKNGAVIKKRPKNKNNINETMEWIKNFWKTGSTIGYFKIDGLICPFSEIAAIDFDD